jgi:sulfur oxidation c-type cytochrome SoxX
MTKKALLTAFLAVVLAVLAVSTAVTAQEKKEEKKEVKLGVEALKMSDAELFPDINKPAQPWTEPAGYKGSKENGAKIFSDIQMGNCAACHCADGVKGCGDIGPSLIRYKKELGEQRTREWLFQKIADARMDNPETVMPPTLSTNTLKPEEAVDVVEFLESLK